MRYPDTVTASKQGVWCGSEEGWPISEWPHTGGTHGLGGEAAARSVHRGPEQ